MLSLSVLSIVPVVIAAGLLGLFTLISNSKQYSNRIFALLSILSAAYVAVNYLADHDQTRALLWVRGTFVLATLMVLSLALFFNSFPKRVLSKTLDSVLTLVAIAVSFATLLPQFVPGVTLTP